MTLGLRTPTAPIYLYHSIHDVLLPVSSTDQLAEDYIAGGAQVTYRRDRASDRVFLLLSGGHDALGWLDERMRGKTLPTRPDVRTVLSTVLSPRAVIMYLRQILAVVKLLAGRL